MTATIATVPESVPGAAAAPGPRRLGYAPSLDGMRAIAIAFVLALHFGQPFLVPGGFGVDVFFVLSGFLITTLLWYELQAIETIRFGSFYLKRAIRLVPGLLITIAVTVSVMPFIGESFAHVALESVSAALYLTPFTMPILGDTAYYGHLWTLAVEEYFYLVWPLALFALWRLRVRWQAIAASTIGLGVLLYLARGVSAILGGPEAMMLRVGGIAIGCGLALILAETSWRGNRALLSLGAVVGIMAAFVLGFTAASPFTYFLAALAAAAALPVVMAGPGPSGLRRVLELRPLVFLGKISYEIYLIHMIVLLPLMYATGLMRYQVSWFVIPVVIAAAAGLHHALAPLQKRWRRRWGGRGV